MFSITDGGVGEIQIAGRFDASQVEAAEAVLGKVQNTTRVNFRGLDYISSAGLGILLKTQKRLSLKGDMLILIGMNKLVRDIFRIARLELVFRIEDEV